jgi:hypothetical protein
MGFIDDMRTEGHAVESICRVLREQGCPVAARTYRVWRRGRPPANRTVSDAVITDAILATGGTPEELYGRRKMTHHLRRAGHQVAFCTVDRIMADLGRNGIRRGKAVRTTIPGKDTDRPGDLVNRQFRAEAPNRIWVADFERHEAFANPGGGGRPLLDACRSRRVEAGGRSIASAWGWLVEQSSTTTSRLSTARWGGLG